MEKRREGRATEPKLRIYLLGRYFWRMTDEAHPATMPELIAYLAGEGAEADRRTLYGDIRLLRAAGLDVVCRRTRTFDYYLASRTFELAELKLLVDAVQSCRFLTVKKSAELIEKLGSLTSRYQAAQLSRQVYVQNRVKTGNERIYYTVDAIHEAIQSARKIAFQYCQYGMDKRLLPKHDGELYVVSPYLLTWAEDNYYLIGDHPHHPGLTHYRVDKMLHAVVRQEPKRPLPPLFDPAAYAKSVFSMYAGEREWMELAFHRSLIGVVIDRFGTDAAIEPGEGDTFTVRVPVSVSPSFFGWLFQFGSKARILSPADAGERMRALLRETMEHYGD